MSISSADYLLPGCNFVSLLPVLPIPVRHPPVGRRRGRARIPWPAGQIVASVSTVSAHNRIPGLASRVPNGPTSASRSLPTAEATADRARCTSTAGRRRAGGFLDDGGVTHFVVPDYFRSLVPSRLGRPGLIVTVSGAVEAAVGAPIVMPAGRAAGAWAAAGITVYPVAISTRHADRGHRNVLWRPAGTMARLAVNLAYTGWAVTVALAAS